MTTQTDVMGEARIQAQPAVTISPWRCFYWCVRRELWENRFVYVGPLAVSALVLVGFLLSTVAGRWEKALRLDAAQQAAKLVEPYQLAALLIMGISFVIAIFYCLEALHGERRDRSILFWKSLPVSDVATVLSKVFIPMVVLPVAAFVLTVVTHLLMFLVSVAVVAGGGQSPAMLWQHVPLFSMSVVLFFHLVAGHGFWYAPIYAWLLLASAWARRAAFLWAALPLLAIGIIERLVFRTSYLVGLLGYRVSGGTDVGMNPAGGMAMGPLAHFNPLHILIDPGLWRGLLLAALLLAAAVRLRRYRGPA